MDKKNRDTKDKRVQVRVSDKELNIFDKVCNEFKLSKSELVLTLVKREYHNIRKDSNG